MPGVPHIHPQNMTDTKTATEFTRAAWPRKIGVSRKPSSDVMATDAAATLAAIITDLNCSNAAIADVTHDDCRTKVRNAVQHAGGDAPQTRIAHPHRQKVSHVTTPTSTPLQNM